MSLDWPMKSLVLPVFVSAASWRTPALSCDTERTEDFLSLLSSATGGKCMLGSCQVQVCQERDAAPEHVSFHHGGGETIATAYHTPGMQRA